MQCTLITISYNFFTIKNSTIKNHSVQKYYFSYWLAIIKTHLRSKKIMKLRS